jgi:hypothetical protein
MSELSAHEAMAQPDRLRSRTPDLDIPLTSQFAQIAPDLSHEWSET